mmetsp:Transcript_110217/g.320972  ORF Transcript_110217/g.320972 Transcript_110217/m.320972 type:complete len:304 (-) Transcript_110217:104-1015(-)
MCRANMSGHVGHHACARAGTGWATVGVEGGFTAPRAPKSFYAHFQALLGGALALAPHPDVCGAALLALPYYDGMPGEARAGVGQRSWRGKFVLALIRWPVMAFCLCSLVCQQRWLWMALLRSAMCVLAKLGCISAATAQGWLYAVEDLFDHSFQSVASSFRSVETFSLRKKFSLRSEGGDPGQQKVRLLLIAGEDDEIVPYSRSVAFANECPIRSEVRVLPGCGHSLTDLPEVRRLVVEWVRREWGGALPEPREESGFGVGEEGDEGPSELDDPLADRLPLLSPAPVDAKGRPIAPLEVESSV